MSGRHATQISDLIGNNRRWASARVADDPAFFQRLATQQAPQFLWIGCSDSRVPANEICGLDPGEMFVHRNIANVMVHSDLNSLSVLQFAIDVLEVRDVIVCGHYGCGGVKAALRSERHGLVDNWLQHVRDVAVANDALLEQLPTEAARHDKLCELNVAAQLRHVARTTVVQDAWRRRQPLAVHGLIYHVEDGLLHDLGLTIDSPPDPDAVRELVEGADDPA